MAHDEPPKEGCRGISTRADGARWVVSSWPRALVLQTALAAFVIIGIFPYVFSSSKRRDLSHQASRRRRSMGQAKTGPPPRQRGPVVRAGGRLFPTMRAWLEQPHGRRHKAPPPPCALTTNGFTTALRATRHEAGCAWQAVLGERRCRAAPPGRQGADSTIHWRCCCFGLQSWRQDKTS